MRYFLGVDGGGSKTLASIVDEYGKEVGKGVSGSIDILNESDEEFRLNLSNAINEALEKAEITLKDLSFSCFGIPAFGDGVGIEDKVKEFISNMGVSSFIVVNDVRVALEGAFPESKGAILLAGTGAMVMAKDENNNLFRIDGWGEHVGDLGSGYFIGQLTLRKAFKEYDGRLNKTEFLNMVKEFAGVSDLTEILGRCKGSNVRKYIANFSKVACKAAEEDVEVGKEILDTAIHELVESVKALRKVLKFTNSMPLSTAGGVFKCRYISEKFKEAVENLQDIMLFERDFEPHQGAVIMAAKKLLNDQEMKRFYQGLSGGIQNENKRG